MVVKVEKKKIVVNYKSLDAVLLKKKKELEGILSKVTPAAKKDLQLQIKAMKGLIGKCKGGIMSRSFAAKMSSKNCGK
jgi:hypothetical protein